MPDILRHPASFKDPSGFVYFYNGIIYRQVNKYYADDFLLLNESGLYNLLTKNNLLIPHKVLHENFLNDPVWHLTLLPEQIPFWSYPYEWSFDQLKDAALLTLELVKLAVEKGMILKDATPFNIQFEKGRPVLIDTLSFEKYDKRQPWVAYRQFCESFLYPLLLSHYHKKNFQNQLYIYPDGLPVDFVTKLLPFKSIFNPSVWLHVYLPNTIGKKENTAKAKSAFSKKKLESLISHLKSVILKLECSDTSVWSNYYSENMTSEEYTSVKERIVREMLQHVKGNKLLDLGANNGHYSLLAAKNNFDVVAIDNDGQCINNLYQKIKSQHITGILPLNIDISNPSPASGFSDNERSSFAERIKTDVVMALALVHHLVIGKNIPLKLLATYFSKLAPQLIIEFVPKEDEKTQLLLKNKKDIYPDYSEEGFENIFLQFYNIESKEKLAGTGRFIYLMKRIETA